MLSYATDKIDTNGLTPGEVDALNIFKTRLLKLEALEGQKAVAQERYEEQKAIKNDEEASSAKKAVASYAKGMRYNDERREP